MELAKKGQRQSALSTQLTSELISVALDEKQVTSKQLTAAVKKASDLAAHQIAGEIVVAGCLSGLSVIDRDLSIDYAMFGDIDLGSVSADMSKVRFNGCAFESLHVDPSSVDFLPRFRDCLVGEMGGIASFDEVGDVFVRCASDAWEATYATTNEIVRSSEKAPVRVMQTIIRKLFFQRGSARQENAFYKGLDTALRPLVDPVINILVSHKFCYWGPVRRGKVLVPVRRRTAEARDLLQNPATSKVPVAREVRELRD